MDHFIEKRMRKVGSWKGREWEKEGINGSNEGVRGFKG